MATAASRGMTTAARWRSASKKGECRKQGKKGDALQKRIRIHKNNTSGQTYDRQAQIQI
jgi:hypothetical protein